MRCFAVISLLPQDAAKAPKTKGQGPFAPAPTLEWSRAYWPDDFFSCSFSAFCLSAAVGSALGSFLVASTDCLMASAFCCPLGILPVFWICVTSFCLAARFVFLAAAFSSGVILAAAALAASLSAFSLA